MTTLVTRVLAKLEPGGAQLSALRVVRGLEAHGIGSRVLVGWASPDGLALAQRMGVTVDVYGSGGDQQWQADPRFARWLEPRLRDAALVHAHMFGGWWAASCAIPDGVPLVASEHNALTWPTGEPPHALRGGLRRVDRLYAHGPGARRAMLDAGIEPALVHDGISPVADLDGPQLPGLPSPRIVFAGRLHAEKGPDVLLDALALLPDAPPALLLGEGPLRSQLARQLRRLGLRGRVRLLGWQARPSGTIAGATVLVVPSRDESWSQTAVLGMARGVPVIGTDVDGLPNTLADGRGIVVPAADPAALAVAIDDVLQGRRTTDLVGARRYAVRFSLERVAAQYAAAYRELTGAPRDDAPEDDQWTERAVVQA
ncbi:glycosyltransferase family 4 protein [Conexibacter sp. CPCC 206217]|uniref:glycosyltransferase family 4 protein n=1 Tax=Conexibacter sp. CPCC 206217 TaxID=3064574 RepID=UPI0027208B71|nr:glycosyltransferase family 4 protein [Conexibacter sp. CPCC 206217]MDO8211722.1 glycosyltransferase family 4 protein [Conexibacter sp. CPCC 206217]